MRVGRDLAGEVFSRLTVLKISDKKTGNRRHFQCVCVCGKIKHISAKSLISGRTKSCGCLQKETVSKLNSKHKLSSCRLHNTWVSMKARCFNVKSKFYRYYGGRGITVCEDWLDKENGFINFYQWAINNGYHKDLTIDRINSLGNYEPSNCRWATRMEQQRNRKNTVSINYQGRKVSIMYLSNLYKIPYNTIYKRNKNCKTITEILKQNEEHSKNN